MKFYALDNEVMLWNSTHRDVHPAAGDVMHEAWTNTLQYATAIKQQEPDALVTGPVTWGYCDLCFRARCRRTATASSAAIAPRMGMPFVAWYLQQVCANPLAGGKHLVDYLDLHYYPQDPNVAPQQRSIAAPTSATAAWRLRSLKELYDPAWVSESWIGPISADDARRGTTPSPT